TFSGRNQETPPVVPTTLGLSGRRSISSGLRRLGRDFLAGLGIDPDFQVFRIRGVEEETLHHFIVGLRPVLNRRFGVRVVRIEGRVVEVRTALDFCSFGKMLLAPWPHITQLPVEAVV